MSDNYENTDPAMSGPALYERIPLDRYETPAWVTEVLISELPKNISTVWEPAAGLGQMVEVLGRYFSVISTDINSGVDFLKETQCRAPTIITNPPYLFAEEFIRHALKLTESQCGVVAMLLRNEFDSASSRRDLFANPPFTKKLVLTKRPYWFEKKASPRHNFSWFIFDHSYGSDPVIKYSNHPKQKSQRSGKPQPQPITE